MIEFSELIPTMEHAMQGSIVFAALAHGINLVWKRIDQWLTNRKWAKWVDFKDFPAEVEHKVETAVEDIKETVKAGKDQQKSKKNV